MRRRGKGLRNINPGLRSLAMFPAAALQLLPSALVHGLAARRVGDSCSSMPISALLKGMGLLSMSAKEKSS